jgi:Asp-tRNA(Asn)/Glu-tRNA(Gln) amidotransferase A subunit family amidase
MLILRELADAVRTRRVSSHELVERSLRRISRLDRQLNAVVALRDGR